MDERRARIHDDLRDLIAGELLFGTVERAPYAVDGSLYEIDPLGVVLPRHEGDLATIVRYASENGIGLHPRGAGTSMAGESLGPGLVIDFSRHFRRVIEIGGDYVVTQPGVVLDRLNAQLAPLGRRIGPEASGAESRTIGGMIGVDSAGMRSLKWGTTARAVQRLDVMFADGETAELGPTPWTVPGDWNEPSDTYGTIVRKLGTLYRRQGEAFARARPLSPRHRAGYAFDRAATPEGIDLARLVVGSEGTLALVTRATLATVPIPTAQGVVVLPFSRLVEAAAVVPEILAFSPAGCELFDWRSISLARDAVPSVREWLPEQAEAALVVLFEDDDAEMIRASVQGLVRRVGRLVGLAAYPHQATKRVDCEPILNLRRVIKPLLMRMKGPLRPLTFIEDVAVPPEQLAEFLQRFENIMKRHEVSWTLFAHAGHGQTHARPFLDLGNPNHVAKLEPIASEVYEAALDLGGTISGEHGCGLARTQFLRRQFGELVGVFREIKDAFDPAGILNPGKVVGDDPHLMTRSLRRMPAAESTSSSEVVVVPPDLPVIDLQFRWGETTPWDVAAACNGCGACRSQDPSMRMCPSFRAARVESASPRAQANLLRQIAVGAIDPRHWGSEQFEKHADLCVHCSLCSIECPSGVDVSALMLEAKAAYVQNHGLPPTDWLTSRLESVSRMASKFPIVTNAILGGRSTRWLLEKATGLSRLRRLPKAHRWSFVTRADRMGLTRPRPQAPGPRVAYLVDIFANHYDQELAESVVGVLRHAGVNVYVPKRQRAAGMSALVVGDVDHARELALANLRVFSSAVRDGYTVVCSEPTATMMLQRHYLALTDDLDAEVVARNTMDVGDYLRGLARRGQLPTPEHPFRGRLGYHQPCHLRALQVGVPGVDLMRMIPELDVQIVDRGCSGMAGTFGLSKKNFRASLRAGRGLIERLREDDIEFGSTECGACRMQMEQGVAKRTVHPIKLLALAYGMNPSLQAKLRTPKRKRALS
ncbi:MAG: FAD-linked oxidase C-terminal domain-containing protein [Isosphaeraceae bacterium]|nr:FAD-linked oxidase C-terminal domain-containing protein [Isosphaeraceae bacterium]